MRALRSKTLIAAYLILGLVLWQAVRVACGGKLPFTQTAKPRIGSTKLHTDRSIASRNNRANIDPITAFADSARRGMSDQEICGMIDDFEAIEQMSTSQDLTRLRDQGNKLNEWYFAALVEALSLTSEQKRTVRSSLAEMFNSRIERSMINNSFVDGEDTYLVTLPILIGAENFYLKDQMEPWKLCDLTADQIKLTYKQSSENEKEIDQMNKDGKVTYRFLTRIFWNQSLTMQDLISGEIMDYPPSSDLDFDCKTQGTTRGGIIDVSGTFPLIPEQKLVDHREDLIAQARLLHPAQLRMALVMRPYLAKAIKSELDKPRE